MTAAASNALAVHTIPSRQEARFALVGLHGWTGDETALVPLVHSVNLNTAQWYFPRAPYPADQGQGFTWFSGSDETGWDYRKTWEGLDHLLNSIQSEGFPHNRIYLLGFSQGACLALEYGLRLDFPLGGLIPIAGFIKNPEKLRREASPESVKIPVLLLHGKEDTLVPPEGSKAAYAFLLERGHSVKLELYSAAHKIPVKASDRIRDFIQN